MNPIEAIIEGVKEIVDSRFEVSPWAGDGWFDGFSIRSDDCSLAVFNVDEFLAIEVWFNIPYGEDEQDTFDMRDAADLDRLFARVAVLFGPGGVWC